MSEMTFPDIWNANRRTDTFFMDTKRSVKDEFGSPCLANYKTALRALKQLKQFHNIDAIFAELKKDVER